MSELGPDEGVEGVEEGERPVEEGLQPDRGAWQVAGDVDEDADRATEEGERGAWQ